MVCNHGEVGMDVTKKIDDTDESNSSDEDQLADPQEENNHAPKPHSPSPSNKPCCSTSRDEDQLANPHEESNHGLKRHCPSPSSEIPGPSKKPCHSTSGDREQLVDSQEEGNLAPEKPYPSSNVAIPELMSASGGSGGPSLVEGPGGPSGVEGPGGPSGVEGLCHALPERPNPVDNQGLDEYNEWSDSGGSGGPSVVEGPGEPSEVEGPGGPSGVEGLCHTLPERPNPIDNQGLDEYNEWEMLDNPIVNVFHEEPIDIVDDDDRAAMVDDEPIDQLVGPLPQEDYDAAAPNVFMQYHGLLYQLVGPLPHEGYDAAAPNAFMEFQGLLYQLIGRLPHEGYDAAAPNAFVDFDGSLYQLIGPLPQENVNGAAPNDELQDLEASSSNDSGFEDNSEIPEQEFYNFFE